MIITVYLLLLNISPHPWLAYCWWKWGNCVESSRVRQYHIQTWYHNNNNNIVLLHWLLCHHIFLPVYLPVFLRNSYFCWYGSWWKGGNCEPPRMQWIRGWGGWGVSVSSERFRFILFKARMQMGGGLEVISFFTEPFSEFTQPRNLEKYEAASIRLKNTLHTDTCYNKYNNKILQHFLESDFKYPWNSPHYHKCTNISFCIEHYVTKFIGNRAYSNTIAVNQSCHFCTSLLQSFKFECQHHTSLT